MAYITSNIEQAAQAEVQQLLDFGQDKLELLCHYRWQASMYREKGNKTHLLYEAGARYLEQLIKRDEESAPPLEQVSSATTVGELMQMLEALKLGWTEQDVEFLGNFEDQTLAYCMGEHGIVSSAKAYYASELGLVFEKNTGKFKLYFNELTDEGDKA